MAGSPPSSGATPPTRGAEPHPVGEPRRPWGCLGCLGVLLLALVIGGGLAAWDRLRGPSEISDSSVEFSDREAPTPAAGPKVPRHREDSYDDGADWPFYGGNEQRTRYLPFPKGVRIRTPFRTRWREGGRILLEFPPVLCGRRLYLLRDDGLLLAIERRTGKVAWARRVGRLAAASPACGKSRVFVTVLKRDRGSSAGQVAAFTTDGKRLWRVLLRGRSESSPLLAGDKLIFGTESGDVLAMSPRNGRVLWRYHAGGKVKGGVARNGPTVFAGDYSGQLHAIALRSGRRRWKRDLGGSLYSTPAVAYGRVFVGNIDGSISAVGERTGRIAWRRRASGYVYSSPAVAPVAGRGPTVFVGSYGGKLYALDARSGRPRWIRDVGGKLSGGVTVVGDLVMYANLGRKRTAIRRARDGAEVFSLHSGAFDPGISDGRRLYLLSYSSIYHLSPRAQAFADARSLRAARRRGR
ncbi:PQQ-binding-like beta-propeller repeat protein [Patulibacter defluvii]|uniref:PQQ-binding-like beta-propeller repeat protein n=1 Tax=Patulibacter defluvii TaxID=3095358 RepID=UPI002A74758E|nr:PQQ-binding-like beta-propeller repeat protein [Patulibacter sp. DM4]